MGLWGMSVLKGPSLHFQISYLDTGHLARRSTLGVWTLAHNTRELFRGLTLQTNCSIALLPALKG